jgi:DNA-binding transcriptional MerR regulator
MLSTDETPTFNMKVVTQETGIKPDTLRAWERRYGLPSPQRTGGGHRLYSQRDIDQLKWLIARQEEGLSISNAVELWQQLEAKGQNPLAFPADTSTRPPEPISGERIDQLRLDWVQACLNFDEYHAQHTLAEAFAIYPVETVCFELLQPALNQIGAGWYDGSITVEQEHFATALALRQLDVLLAATPPAKGQGRLLIACPPQEEHTFSPLLLTLLLRRRNWDVVYLGANVPLERLEKVVQTINPQLVILIAQTLFTAGTMLPLADLLQQAQIPMAFGGAVFTHLEETRSRIPGHFLGPELRHTPESIDRLVQSQPRLPEVKRATMAYRQALSHFQSRRAAIEAHVYQASALEQISETDLSHANEDLGNNIAAALTLGSMDLLTANIDWVKGVLVNYRYRIPAESLAAYVKTYHEAVRTELDDRGEPVRIWFDKLTGSPDFLKRLSRAG